jgi:hypothetical protein
MRSGWLLLAMTMIAGGARAAQDCATVTYLRSRAECIDDQMSPDVIDRLYQLALSTVHGKFDPDHLPEDFVYIAEEAGEAARRIKNPKPLVEMASSDEVTKVVFAARAITAFVDAVQDGFSHRPQLDDKGDTKQFAAAKPTLRAPCKRLAAHDNRLVREEGERCLKEIDRTPGPDPSRLFPANADEVEASIRAVTGSSPGACLQVGCPGGLRASDGVRPLRAHETSKPSSKAGSRKHGARQPPTPPASN